MDLESRLSELRKRASDLERLRATQQAHVDQAEVQMRQEAQKLAESFGCRSLEEAKALLETKKAETEKLLAEVEGLLK